jgi:predicted DNA-binding transcriptional regulator AlpA
MNADKTDGGTTLEKLLTAAAIGEMLCLSKRQVFRLNSSGRIPKPVRIGGSVRWRESDIHRWIALSCPDRGRFEATMAA